MLRRELMIVKIQSEKNLSVYENQLRFKRPRYIRNQLQTNNQILLTMKTFFATLASVAFAARTSDYHPQPLTFVQVDDSYGNVPTGDFYD